eukprot:TRINITY_DN3338_c0_g4_i1.p1 TRINITY_DN3338_c0_g4~~TRINITY_DN3338_c0_g4_i1.p1  ORF type:complete len:253 (-),score=57.27 TRINITY_DN3338_c0_g4_i1:167-925(-)
MSSKGQPSKNSSGSNRMNPPNGQSSSHGAIPSVTDLKKAEAMKREINTLARLLQEKDNEMVDLESKETEMDQQLVILAEALAEKKSEITQQLDRERKKLAELNRGDQPEETSPEWEMSQLVELAVQAKSYSYSPYSNFRVGCILKTESGAYYRGCNVENVSYGLAICAERTAMVKAVSEGHKKFEKIVITSDMADMIVPCGACRQFMSEFGDFEVYLTKGDKTYKKYMVSDLLPFSFNSSDLVAGQVQQNSS